jgi:quinolinate synthase
MLARGLDHRAGCPVAARTLSRRSCRHLRQHLGRREGAIGYLPAETGVRIVTWAGHCEVHERFTAVEIRELRDRHPGVVVLAHPECPPEVVAEADFAGSTAAMSAYVADRRPRRVVLVTECSMSDNVALQHPDVEFVRPCNLCPHMKRITLPKIRRALETMHPQVTIEPEVAAGARRAVERMLAI